MRVRWGGWKELIAINHLHICKLVLVKSQPDACTENKHPRLLWLQHIFPAQNKAFDYTDITNERHDRVVSGQA